MIGENQVGEMIAIRTYSTDLNLRARFSNSVSWEQTFEGRREEKRLFRDDDDSPLSLSPPSILVAISRHERLTRKWREEQMLKVAREFALEVGAT